MSSSNHIFIIIVFFIVEISTICCQSKHNNVTFDCVPSEKKALLKFKSSFTGDPSKYNTLLSSWKSNTSCCSWAGVECDNATGHVIGLDMSGVNLSRTNDVVYMVLNMLPSLVDLSLSNCGLGDTNLPLANCVNRSTLPFNKVQYLDMSSNSFGANSSFCFLQNMTSLSYLDLSNNSIHQKVDWINDLLWDKCHLKSLYLGYNRFYGDISVVFNNLSAGCWGRNLENLFLTMNEFNGPIPSSLGNLRALRLLSLSHNPLGGEIPISLGQLSKLEGISIIDNKLSGPIPSSLGNLRALTVLKLSDNQLCGEIPFSLGQLSNLELMIIFDNKLSGPIPFSLGNMRALRVLGLGSNKLDGEVPFSLGQLSNLERMDICDNKLSGPIPFSLGNMRALIFLDLSSNQLGGKIPISLGQLSNLEVISMHNNSLEGTLSEAHFANLSRLGLLYICDNKMVKLKVRDNWVPPFHQLLFLNMGSVKIETQFPQWIKTQKSLMELDLRNCSIRGTLPAWLGSLMNLTRLNLNNNHIEGTLPPWLGSLNNLSVLDLSNNRFEGPIPDLPSKMKVLDLSDNMITNHLPSNIAHMMPFLRELYLARNLIDGSIPESLCQMKDLYYLDLSRNHLSGHLPDCNWGNLSDLRVAILSSNHLYGTIPNSIGGGDYCSLRLLQLDNNSFTGLIPITLTNCKSLIVLDVGDNKLSGGNLPEWIGIYLMDLAVLRIRNNKFDGDIPSSYCRLYRLQVMDLAYNQLTGYIPKCLDNLWGMTINVGGSPPVSDGWSSDVMESTSSDSMELRWNQRWSLSEVMKGAMLEYTCSTSLEYAGSTSGYLVNLDLSSNRLFGDIPSEITNLTGLKGLNLSHNYLGGRIQENIGDLKSLESLDLSSNNLLGTIPSSLSKLTSLSLLNLSNNDLLGPIPTGPQLQTLNDPSIYEGNPGLCGDPLPKKCRFINNGIVPQQTWKVENDDGDTAITDNIYLFAFITSGVATGFWGYFGVLVFKRSWRLALFRPMDALIAKMLGRY